MQQSNDYDNIPMVFCSECLWHGKVDSIVINGQQVEYCPYCGSTSFREAPAREWDEMFQKKYCRPSYYLCKEKSWEEIMRTPVSKEDASMVRYKINKILK